jgi:hypothetical protein
MIAESEVVTIMACCSRTEGTLEHAFRAVKSHKETCDSVLIVFDNNSPEKTQRAKLAKFVRAHGYVYRYFWPRFSLTGIYNLGTKLTDSTYIVHSTSDVEFHPHWLDELIFCHKEWGGEYASYHPYSKPTWDFKGLDWRETPEPGKVMPTTMPIAHVTMFHRPDVYHWDEALVWWESDVDYWYWMKKHKKVAAVCCGARVDTSVRGIVDNLPWADGEELRTGEAWHYLKRKWINEIDMSEDDYKQITGHPDV